MPARACPICGTGGVATLLDRSAAPVLLNKFYESKPAAEAAPTGRIELVACRSCGFVFNRRFDPALIVYDASYENDQTRSPAFARHLDAVAARLSGALGRDRAQVRGTRILEIGCGQGALLETLLARGGGRIEAVGYDPAWRDRPLAPGLRFAQAAFGAGQEQGRFDLVYARHALEHVAAPLALLQAMAAALAEGGRLCLEVPDLAWSLAHGQMQDFCYEHCNYFTRSSLTELCRRAGLGVLRLETMFEGQYLWAEAAALDAAAASAPPWHDLMLTTPILPAIDAAFFGRWRARLAELGGVGTIALWGAGAKGVTFATELDPEGDRIACLIDVNPMKQGRFIPCSAHPVLSPEAVRHREIQTIIVMNPNYHREIAAAVAASGWPAQLLSC
jgi:SAM-dependent methyltransferase